MQYTAHSTAQLIQLLTEARYGDCLRLSSLGSDFPVAGTLTLPQAGLTLDCGGAVLRELAEKTTTLKINADGTRLINARFVGLGTETPWANASTEYNGVAGVRIESSDDVLVEGCSFSNHAGSSLALVGRCVGTSIHRNHIYGMGASHIKQHDNGCDGGITITGNTDTKHGLRITDNYITGHAFGLFTPAGVGIVIANNVIRGIPGQHGMYIVQGGDMVIANNVVADCAVVGIKIQHQLPEDVKCVAKICGNTVTRIGYFGIAIMGAAAGVDWHTTNIMVTDNSVVDAQKGIYIRYARNAVVTGNRLADCEDGLHVLDSTGVFEPNYVMHGMIAD